MSRRRTWWLVPVLVLGGCAAGDDDDTVAPDAHETTGDAACDFATCDAQCLAVGYLGGACRSGTCVCLGTLAADADADAEVEIGAEADVGGEAEADVVDVVPDTGPGYTCIESVRNGSEICDDQAFTVPSPYVPMGIVCLGAEGGVLYVSTNTGPTMSDGVARCQGWEERGENAWDYLAYVVQLHCTEEGRIHPVDLSAYAGDRLWFGAHDLPTGGGHMTEGCIATVP